MLLWLEAIWIDVAVAGLDIVTARSPLPDVIVLGRRSPYWARMGRSLDPIKHWDLAGLNKMEVGLWPFAPYRSSGSNFNRHLCNKLQVDKGCWRPQQVQQSAKC